MQNLSALGVKYDKNISKSTKSIDKHMMERTKVKLQQSSMPSERFTTILCIFFINLEIIMPNLI